MIETEFQWCKLFIESLNGRAPSAAELYDFLDSHIVTREDALDNGYALGWAAATEYYNIKENNNG